MWRLHQLSRSQESVIFPTQDQVFILHIPCTDDCGVFSLCSRSTDMSLYLRCPQNAFHKILETLMLVLSVNIFCAVYKDPNINRINDTKA